MRSMAHNRDRSNNIQRGLGGKGEPERELEMQSTMRGVEPLYARTGGSSPELILKLPLRDPLSSLIVSLDARTYWTLPPLRKRSAF